MCDSQQYSRYSKASCPFENRENRDPQTRQSYLRNFQQKEKQQKNQMQIIFKDTDQSIENILNSSMSHIDKVIQGVDTQIQSLSVQDVLKQNIFLKENLIKMKKILKQKLQAGLSKQRQQLTQVIGDYMELITKLLKDKQQLTSQLKNKECSSNKQTQLLFKIQSLKQHNNKLLHVLTEKDKQIQIDKIKLDQFLTCIQQYEEEHQKQQQKMQEMQLLIQQYQAKDKNNKQNVTSNSFYDKKDPRNAKVQKLLELLEATEQKNIQLKEQIKKLQRSKQQLREVYEEKIITLNSENQQQFLEYEKAVRETLDKKEDCIERLNAIIQSLKCK